MKRIALVAAIALAGPAIAQSNHYVQGYVRNDGTYVQPHYQTNPDGRAYNNYSTQGNVNPYTGQTGTVNPYATPNPFTAGPPAAYGSSFGRRRP